MKVFRFTNNPVSASGFFLNPAFKDAGDSVAFCTSSPELARAWAVMLNLTDGQVWEFDVPRVFGKTVFGKTIIGTWDHEPDVFSWVDDFNNVISSFGFNDIPCVEAVFRLDEVVSMRLVC